MEERHAPRLTSRKIPPLRPLADIALDARRGLTRRPRWMPPKYFYDERGSRLFDAICDTPEYYPTRTEDALLGAHAADIVAQVQPEHIVEFGSGTARKTRHLLDACCGRGAATAYWPFDVCETMLLETGQQLVDEYRRLRVHALVGDYLGGLQGLPPMHGRCLFLFLGGTIGNFTEPQAELFLREVHAAMKPGDFLMLGADRVKPVEVLHAAYNDSAGLTAQFNLNLLRVLNRELGADFRLAAFRHRAFFNSRASQIEMYLVASRAQSVRVTALDQALHFACGEEILTEISRKFTRPRLESMLRGAGFTVARHLQPDNGYFSLLLAGRG